MNVFYKSEAKKGTQWFTHFNPFILLFKQMIKSDTKSVKYELNEEQRILNRHCFSREKISFFSRLHQDASHATFSYP